LSGADTPAAQAKAASSLGETYERAATRLERLRISPALGAKQDATVSALQSAAAAYAALAAAAGRADHGAYARSSGRIRAAESHVSRQLKAFER
jgi:hypothetical protein